MFLKAGLTVIYNFSMHSFYPFLISFLWVFHLNTSMRFYDVTLNVLWYICSATGFIIIKTTFFIAENNLFILGWGYIHSILNSIIQIIKSFICLLYFVNICFIGFIVCLLQLCLQCSLIMFEIISKNHTIYTYIPSFWPNRNIRKFSQPMHSESLPDTYR